ncbi:MAG: hypothetical protein ACKO96_13925, partial [Flammeovirgaceae bacterium]
MRALLPDFLKPVIRFVYYPQERERVFREPKVKRIQDEKIKQYDASARKLIIFFVEGIDHTTGTEKISGGAISIVSLCAESRKIKDVHKSEVVLCTLPGHYLFTKYKKFKNDEDVLRIAQLEEYFKRVNQIMIHLPEYLSCYFINLVRQNKLSWFRRMNKIHLNILNQNIRLMPTAATLADIKADFSYVTITTAHSKYCTHFFREQYKVPIHKFSVWISPERYKFRSYSKK